MFERKLAALEFYSANKFNYEDEKEFRNFITWLENQKIRLYKVDDRADLDRVEDENWPNAFQKYLNDLNLDDLSVQSDRAAIIERLLSHAISLEYADNMDKYNVFNTVNQDFNRQDSENPLEHIDYNCFEFKEGITKLQKLLNIPSKRDDHLAVLQAISQLISEKLNPTAISQEKEADRNKKVDSIQLTMQDINLGFDTNDKILNDAAKILRLLHIKELRAFQTKINQTIVSIQNITANPKTDSSLGKVGK